MEVLRASPSHDPNLGIHHSTIPPKKFPASEPFPPLEKLSLRL